MTEHPELRKGRQCLFVLIKNNNAGKELSAATISRWICTNRVDSHDALWDSKSIQGTVKAHEVFAMATPLQLLKGRPISSNEGRKMIQWRHNVGQAQLWGDHADLLFLG